MTTRREVFTPGTQCRPPTDDDPAQIVARCGMVHLTRTGAVACRAHSKRSGKCCTRPPTPGHAVCHDHGARTPQAKAAAARRLALAEAEAELDRLGGVVDVEPAEAMVAMVQEAAWNVAVYRRLVQTLDASTTAARGDLEGDEDGQVVDPRVLAAGLAGRVDPANWKAAPHVWVSMYDAERERLVRWSKLCRDAGVDEHRVRVLEAQAEQLVGVAHEIAAGLQAALTTAGVAAELVSRVVEDSLPGVMRTAFEKAHALEVQEVAHA